MDRNKRKYRARLIIPPGGPGQDSVDLALSQNQFAQRRRPLGLSQNAFALPQPSAGPDATVIEIDDRISASMSINRDTLAQVNTAHITFINLKRSSRNLLYKDRFNIVEGWNCEILGGYNDDLPQIFVGNIFDIYSYRDGTDWFTVMTGKDGIYSVQNGFSSFTIEGVTVRDIINRLLEDMPDITLGSVSTSYDRPMGGAVSEHGKASDILYDFSDGKYFIDNGRLHVILDDEYLTGRAIDIDNFIGTPKREGHVLTGRTLFTPEVQVGKLVNFNSSIHAGTYKVIGLKHNIDFTTVGTGQGETEITVNAGFGGGLKEVA